MRAYTPDDIVKRLLGRRWMILIPFALGLAIAPILARLAPERYRSETLIVVVPQRVPDSYVKATITDSIEARLPSISEQILSRSRLERIITNMDLYKDLRARTVMEEVVQRMRSQVTVSLAANASRDDSASFRVSYVSDHAQTARDVTDRLASLYIEQNLKDRENQARSTSEFLETQLQDAKTRLVEHEKKLEAYRRAHAGELPTQLQGNLQSIQGANLQLQALHESMNRALERRLLIERQIADSEALPVADANAAAPSAANAPLTGTTSQRLELAKARLAAMLQVFTPNHPEVITAQRMVNELQIRLEGEAPIDDSVPVRPTALSPAEAALRKRTSELKAELLVVERQLESNHAEEEMLKAAIASLQAKVDVLPSRESELVELTRDYGTLQAAYTNLLTKREDSVMAANLEQRQIGEQFRVVDPASLPEKPYNEMQRLGVTFSGAAAGLVLGLLAVVFLELKDSSFRSEDEVMAALSLPVLAIIPVMASPRERHQSRVRRRWMDVGGVLVLASAVAVVVFWRLRS